MTILAQFHDCHSCYDERSIDQKNIVLWVSFCGVLVLVVVGFVLF